MDREPHPTRQPFAIRLFTTAARIVLPLEFQRDFGTELETALLDRYRLGAGRSSVAARLRFWLRETAGLAVTALRERRDALDPRRKPGRAVHPPTPQRERNMLNSLRHDFWYALRMIRKTPIVSAIAVVSLAIGLAANTTVFGLLHTWLLRPLPYPDVERLVMVWENDLVDEDDTELATPANFFDWQTEAVSLTDWIAIQFTTANLTAIERPEQLTVATVTPNYFAALGARPLLGRTFQPDEGGAEDAPVTVMNETLWRTRFGAAPDVIGSTVTLDGVRHTVIGIMPETFDFLWGNVSLWTATDLTDRRFDRATHDLIVTAWIEPGNTLQQTQAEMTALASRLATRYPESNENYGVNVQTVRQVFPGPTDSGLIKILMAVVLLVLLIACVNVSSLAMAKSDARQGEIGVRMALGAGRSRLIGGLLTESVVIALSAGALSFALSGVGISAVTAAMPPEMPEFFRPRLSGPVIGYTVAISLLAGLMFGIAPALHAVGAGISSPLIEGSRGGTASRRRSRLRSAFVVAQFALALTILMGAGVLTDLFHQRLAISPGFNPTNLVKAELQLPQYKYPDDAAVRGFVEQLSRELEMLPQTSGFTFTNVLPRSRTIPSADFTVDGRAYEPNEEPRTSWLSVGRDYFAVMDIALRAGRVFAEIDREDTPPVAIVNRRWADLYSDGEPPLGRRITIQGESREIVGVVGNIAQMRLSGLNPHEPTVYFPLAQRPVRSLRIVLRADGDPNRLVLPLQNAVWAVDRDQPIMRTQSMQSHMASELAGPIVMTQILVVIGALTLALAATGIYGVMAYSVSQRTREIGIRMALGATAQQILGRVTRQGATLAGTGLLLGVPFAALALRTINSLLEQAASADGLEAAGSVIAPGPIVTITAVLVAVGLVASFLPARRATQIDPVKALGD
jgi:putative ABC transport system permease protein